MHTHSYSSQTPNSSDSQQVEYSRADDGAYAHVGLREESGDYVDEELRAGRGHWHEGGRSHILMKRNIYCISWLHGYLNAFYNTIKNYKENFFQRHVLGL